MDAKYVTIVFVSVLALSLVSMYLYMAYTVSRISDAYKQYLGLRVKDMKDESFRFWLADKQPHGNVFQRHYNLMMLFRDLVNCFLLLILYYRPLAMVILMTIFQTCFSLAVVQYPPYEKKWMNLSALFTHASYVVLDILYIINLASPGLSGQDRYNYIGFPMILSVLAIIALNVGFSTYYGLKQTVTKWKRNRDRKTKVRDVNSSTSPERVNESSISSVLPVEKKERMPVKEAYPKKLAINTKKANPDILISKEKVLARRSNKIHHRDKAGSPEKIVKVSREDASK